MKVEIYTKPNCHWCSESKKLLDDNKIEYTNYKIGENITIDEVRAKFPDAKTVPIILFDDVFLGGYQELLWSLTNDT